MKRPQKMLTGKRWQLPSSCMASSPEQSEKVNTMSVFANPLSAIHVTLEKYNGLTPTALQNQLAKGGWIILSTGGFCWPWQVNKFFLKSAWDAIPPADQKTMIDSGDIVMVTEN
jgi:hypothetical protein